MRAEQAAIARHRFGLGGRPGDAAEFSGDPVAALLEDVATARAPAGLAQLPGTPILFARQIARKEQKATAVEARQPAGSPIPPLPPAAPDAIANTIRDAVLDEIGARLAVARAAPLGFGERLAQFWTNHFTVAGTNPQVHILCGAFEREAIRPHLAGRFADMLLAAESHPAMLHYLNNVRSMGPKSPAGLRQDKGLNENLAREVLELHTVGVDGGYTQTDVTAFAGALTGWSVVGGQGQEGVPGSFVFRQRMHEPGPRLLLGRSYAQDGQAQGQAILADLALHPATAKHIATKLVRHFIADEPPPAAVALVTAAYLASGGELMPVYEALLRSPAAFARPLGKLRPPLSFAVAAVRALDVDLAPQRLLRALTLLGQPSFKAPSPQGWPDVSSAWLAPDAIAKRLELATTLSQAARADRPVDRARAVLGPLMSAETTSAIEQADSGPQALALLLMSPEFQRR